ncbi:methyltransferase domain-containing protein [Candidatus Uhrbacteria bacterium]|nr:methyltransferase domain-containing protein [Candidatus Uhrbacteria bacterium]
MPYIPSGSEVLNPKALAEKMGVAEGMTVADLGCGTQGHFVFPAAHLVGSKGKVYAVDILKSALSGVESRAKVEEVDNVETVWSDLEVYGGTKVPELDLAMLINNLPKEPMLKEAARVVKKGGKLVVIDWKPSAAPLGPPSKDRVDKDRIKNLLISWRFRLTEDFEAGPYHFGLVFVKE